MIESWVEDGRKIPGLVMSYIRKIAVRAVEKKGYSPEAVRKWVHMRKRDVQV